MLVHSCEKQKSGLYLYFYQVSDGHGKKADTHYNVYVCMNFQSWNPKSRSVKASFFKWLKQDRKYLLRLLNFIFTIPPNILFIYCNSYLCFSYLDQGIWEHHKSTDSQGLSGLVSKLTSSNKSSFTWKLLVPNTASDLA